jgi:uncharacterized protein YjlB
MTFECAIYRSTSYTVATYHRFDFHRHHHHTHEAFIIFNKQDRLLVVISSQCLYLSKARVLVNKRTPS